MNIDVTLTNDADANGVMSRNIHNGKIRTELIVHVNKAFSDNKQYNQCIIYSEEGVSKSKNIVVAGSGNIDVAAVIVSMISRVIVELLLLSLES